MIDTRPTASAAPATDQVADGPDRAGRGVGARVTPTHLRTVDIRGLVATDYSRHQVAAAIHESIVEALHARACDISVDERAWVRSWLTTTVPTLTERILSTLVAELDTGLWDAPPALIDRLEARRARAELGVE